MSALPFQLPENQRPRKLAASSIVGEHQSVSAHSVFSDSVWNMESRVSLPGVRPARKSWDFSAVPGFPGGFALSLAEYAYARLLRPVESYEEEVTWLTVVNDLNGLIGFIIFCRNSNLTGFGQVRREHYEGYLRTLQFSSDGDGKSDDRIRFLVGAVYRLWDYRVRVGDCLVDYPFGKSIEKLLKGQQSRRLENLTPVIPEPVFGPSSAVALDYVSEYGPVIIDVWLGLRNYWDSELKPQQLGHEDALRKLRLEASRRLAIVPAPWRKNGWSTIGHLYNELQQLRTSAMWVVLAFSGVRASELLALEAHCCVSDTCSDGHIRKYINTKVHKHRDGGAKDAWVVVDEVAEAIYILEKLSARVGQSTGDARLFLSDGTGHFFGVHRVFRSDTIGELTFEGLVKRIESFQRHCSEVLGRPIPDWMNEEGEFVPWKFNTRQFRRTLARYIVRQPFGVIAGMLQYKHIEVAIFEGYAGLEPEWNKLLSDEKVLAGIDILDEVAIDLSNGQLAGGLGQELKEQFALEFKGRAEDFPPSQIARWLSRAAKPLFVGKLNFCFFDPVKAVCTKGASEAPVLNRCQPSNCANACIGKRHLPIWEAQLKQAEEFIAWPKSSRVHREAMSVEVAKLRAVLNDFGDVE